MQVRVVEGRAAAGRGAVSRPVPVHHARQSAYPPSYVARRGILPVRGQQRCRHRALLGRTPPQVNHPTINNGWRPGVLVSGVRRMNEVNARRARLVPGWVTVFGRVYHLGV